MIQPPESRRPPLTPQLALRVAILGSFALALFAIIFFRLWFLQVLSGDKYVAQVAGNQVRYVDVPAARGKILDRGGAVLVDSKRAIAVQISPPDLPVPLTPTTLGKTPRKDAQLYGRLARVLAIPTARQKCLVTGYVQPLRLSPIGCAVAQGYALVPYANVTVKKDVPNATLYYLEERQNQFPGVQVQPIWSRSYPLHDVAAQLFGTIGPVSQAELKQRRFHGLPQSSIVGQSGLEWYYNHYLQGTDGSERVQVDALGRFTGSLGEKAPVAGHNLKLSLDVGLQKAGESALGEAISSSPPSNGGAFVALNPDTGEVYAMGSNPSFDPNIFTKPLSSSQFEALNNASSGYPLIDRAIQSAGPTGSTFKPITATAALESGAWNVGNTYDDTGSFTIDGQTRHNAGGAADGVLNLTSALMVSSDVFFYNLGALTNADPTAHPNGGALQQWARRFGIGRPTGIDLGGEVAGNLPTPRWRAGRDKLELECENATGPFKGKPKHPAAQGGCGIADGRPWSIGDNVSLAVGQGDVQATPLQLATAYSAIANGGTVVRPHIGLDVQQPDGTILQRIDPPPARHLNINPLYLQTIQQGLHEAAQSPGGTSDDVMGNFPQQVYGKTGTAQYTGQQDYSWYVCFVPSSATSKPILVVVWVEQGGFGAQAAAPAARQILSQWFYGNRGPYQVGSSKTL
ncbi:MAG TPA: penicillin-binding protein 2 [Solirubrobacteraceae bacterium]